MNSSQLVEAALFVSTNPISIGELSRVSGMPQEEVKNVLERLAENYRSRESALEIRKIGDDQYMMQVKDVFAAPLLSLVKPAVSSEVLKTLSVIALKQPVAQAEVVKARGYSTYVHVKELVGKEFISAAPKGRTKILTTTKKFADYFALPPKIEELKKSIAGGLSDKH